MQVSHLIVSDSFTDGPRAVAVNFSETARRATTAALLREYRAHGFTVRTIETGAMYRADAPHGYHVNIWYTVPNRYGIDPITVLNIPHADKGKK